MGKISYSNLLFADNNQLRLGTGSDLRIYHNGSNSFIQDTGTGDLRLMSSHLKLMDTSENLVLGVQAGAVAVTGTLTVGVDDTGHDVKFFGATSGRYMLWDESDNALELTDNTKIKLGDDSDFQLNHSGTNSFITNTVGDINIINHADNGDIKFQADDGSGGDALYFAIDGGAEVNLFLKNGRFNDNVKALFGGAGDLQIYHDGSNSYIDETGTGSLYIKSAGAIRLQSDTGENMIYAVNDSSVYLYHNNVKKFETTSTGVTVTGSATFTGDILVNTATAGGYIQIDQSDDSLKLADANKLKLGTGNDLQIYHDGSHSYIADAGTGHLQILSSQLQINNAGNTENMITAAEDGSVTLFNDGSAKLATSSTGIDVTGEVKGDSLDIDGNADISGQLVLPQTSTTIGGSNTGNASLLIGSSSNGIGIDTNEIVSKGDHLYIGAATNDKSIIFRTDATVNVLTLDSSQDATFTGDVRLPQSGKLYLWTGHDSNYLRYDLWTGSASAGMTIKNTAADGEVYLWSGNTLALTLNDSQNATFAGDILVNTATAGGYIQIDQSDDSLKLADVNKLKLGIGNDLQIYHDGSNSYIRTQGGGTGNLIFTQNIDGADMIFKCDDGAGATTNYFLLDGGGVLTRFYKKLRAQDNVNIEAGSSGDVKIKHDGNHSYITNDTGTLYLQSNEADGDILFRADDGTGSSTTDYFRIDGSDVIMKAHKSIRFLDNVKATFGNSDDLQIYHDGSNSYINEVGNLDLYIQTNGNNMFLRNNANGDTFVAMNTGSRNVQLRMSNSTKLETTAYGVKTFYAATSNTDGDAAGDIVNLGESTTVAGKIYYYTSSGSWELADADAESTAKGMLAVALGTSSNTHGMLIRGMVTLDHDPGTIADTLFLSTSAGAATATAPSGTGDIVRVIGYSLNSTNGQIYFNPDGAFVEVTAG